MQAHPSVPPHRSTRSVYDRPCTDGDGLQEDLLLPTLPDPIPTLPQGQRLPSLMHFDLFVTS